METSLSEHTRPTQQQGPAQEGRRECSRQEYSRGLNKQPQGTALAMNSNILQNNYPPPEKVLVLKLVSCPHCSEEGGGRAVACARR